MNSDSVTIGFRNHRVLVTSPDQEIVSQVLARFQAMSVEPGNEILSLEITGRDGDYGLAGPEGATIRAGSVAEIVKEAEACVLRTFIDRTPDLLWFHAAAAASPEGAVLIVGPFGAGKSTIVTELCDAGWAYLSDDVIPIDPKTMKALAYPRSPNFREGPSRSWSSERVRALRKTERPADRYRIEEGACSIGGLLFPVHEPGASLETLSIESSAAAQILIEACLNFDDHGDAALRCVRELAVHPSRLRVRFGRREGIAEAIVEALNQNA